MHTGIFPGRWGGLWPKRHKIRFVRPLLDFYLDVGMDCAKTFVEIYVGGGESKKQGPWLFGNSGGSRRSPQLGPFLKKLCLFRCVKGTRSLLPPLVQHVVNSSKNENWPLYQFEELRPNGTTYERNCPNTLVVAFGGVLHGHRSRLNKCPRPSCNTKWTISLTYCFLEP